MKTPTRFKPGLAFGLSALLTGCFLLPRLGAEQGGSGHYVPGTLSSFIDKAPTKPGSSLEIQMNYYRGDAEGSMPIGNQRQVGVTGEQFTFAAVIFGTAPGKFLGAHYSAGLSLPVTKVDVSATVTGPAGRAKIDNENGDFADLPIMPLILAWPHGAFQTDLFFTVYAPLGQYDTGVLANTSKNYWTYEPTLGFHYNNARTLLHCNLFVGYDFNDRNQDEDYRSGESYHVELSLSKFFSTSTTSTFGFGLTAMYYEQVTGDTGRAAVLGDFKGKDMAIGPTFAHSFKNAWNDVMLELKWLKETDVTNRLKGDYIWFKARWAY